MTWNATTGGQNSARLQMKHSDAPGELSVSSARAAQAAPAPVNDARLIAHLKAQASRCSRLAQTITDDRTAETLRTMAVEYEKQAKEVGGGS